MPANADRVVSIRARIEDSAEVRRRLLDDDAGLGVLAVVAGVVVDSLQAGGKVLFFGNGGSSADAQHLAAELLGRFYHDRAALPAIALTDNTAALTAIANDYEYAEVFSRQLAGLARPGDVAIGFSTSGESENVVRAIALARSRQVHTVAFTRAGSNRLADAAEHCIAVPSSDTPRIQEAHMLLGHTLCELVEQETMASRSSEA